MTQTKPKPKRIYKAPALEKGLEIIELLATKQIPMSMTEIATELGRSGNEIFRMLAVLEQKNYIRKGENGDRYGITNHLFDLGMRVPPNSTLIEHLVPLMRDLAGGIQQSCHLSVLSGNHIVVIARVESPANVGFSVRVGTSRGLLESAAGRVFLAWTDDGERGELVRELVKGAGATDKRKKLDDELGMIRSLGHAKIPSSFITGITDICVPVTAGHPRKIVATLTVPYAAGSDAPLTLEQTVPLVLESVSGMSKVAATFRSF